MKSRVLGNGWALEKRKQTSFTSIWRFVRFGLSADFDFIFVANQALAGLRGEQLAGIKISQESAYDLNRNQVQETAYDGVLRFVRQRKRPSTENRMGYLGKIAGGSGKMVVYPKLREEISYEACIHFSQSLE